MNVAKLSRKQLLRHFADLQLSSNHISNEKTLNESEFCFVNMPQVKVIFHDIILLILFIAWNYFIIV